MIVLEPEPRSKCIGIALRNVILFVPRIVYHAITPELENCSRAMTANPRSVSTGATPSREISNVVSWVSEFEIRNGRKPRIPELQAEFPDVPKTTAWRRIKSA